MIGWLFVGQDFAQFDERYQLAQATHKVSVFAEGILAMDTTLVGVIKVGPTARHYIYIPYTLHTTPYAS